MEIQKLIEIGGVEWSKNGKHRIYFNNLAELFGLKIERYNTGQICSATLDGDKISNKVAHNYLIELMDVKIWFDVKTQEFCELNGDGYEEDIFPEIKRRYAALPTPTTTQKICDCGHYTDYPMSTANGSSCEDCYDNMENR